MTDVLREGTARFATAVESARVANAVSSFAYGDVLEIGYGLGHVHRALHESPFVASVTTIEKRPGIGVCHVYGCNIIHGDWRDHEGAYDRQFHTIVLDTGVEDTATLDDLRTLAWHLIAPKHLLIRAIKPYNHQRLVIEFITRQTLRGIEE